MKKTVYYTLISIALILISLSLFSLHIMIFKNTLNTLNDTLINIAFIPIDILVVTIIFDNIVDYKNYKDRNNKLNMLVGLFYNEIGFQLMHYIIQGDKNAINLITDFSNINELENLLRNHNYVVNIDNIDIKSIKNLLYNNNSLLINLISNENIILYDDFTDLLMDVTHIRDEIIFIEKYGFPELGQDHIEEDLDRLYNIITLEWIKYIRYLEKTYPFLYHNAVRLNPFVFK